jgi:hypothetical protein
MLNASFAHREGASMPNNHFIPTSADTSSLIQSFFPTCVAIVVINPVMITGKSENLENN